VASLVGKELGKYRITERIGRGGMAEVYLAVHTMLDRQVAIKVLHGYLTEDVNFIERFKREAKAVANLRHPNIVQVHDFDIYEDMLFMVMEYIDGTNLHQRLVELGKQGKRLPIKQVGTIINDIASALDYAHTQGMLHRDVKPSNILLDSRGKAYLTDFGIARIVSDHRLTATGTMLGTPAYMSPEQGRGEELTEESDIYSLGIVAFEMLTGRVPYDAKTPIAIVQKQINDPVPAINSLVDDMPPTTQEVIDRALAKSPDVRYSSAEELVSALRIALHALESSQAEHKKAEPNATAMEKAAAPTEVPQPVIGTDEDALSAATVAMEEEGSVIDKATEVMEEIDLDKATVAMQDEEIAPPQQTTEAAQPKAKQEKPVPARKKMPLWAWITLGAVVLGGAAFAISQMLPEKEVAEPPAVEEVVMEDDSAPQPEREEPEPEPQPEEVLVEEVAFLQEPGVLVFDADNMDGGLILRLNEDVDVEMVTAGENQETAWRTGNGEVLPGDDGNDISDSYIMFDVDNGILFEAPNQYLQAQIEVEYLDEGTDSFHLQYDAHSGGPYDDGRYRETENIEKTNSGDFKTAVFGLDEVFFGDRMGPEEEHGDFRINDNLDGAETIRRVILRVPSAEQAFVKGDYAREKGDFERAIRFYEHAMHAGFDDPAWGHMTLGVLYAETGQYDACVANMGSAIELNPDDIDAYLWRADCFTMLDDNISAAIHYQEFLARSEGDPRYIEQRKHAEGVLEEIDISEAQRDMNEAEMLREEGRFEEAIEFYTRAINGGIENIVWAYNMRGLMYRETGQWELCIEDYTVFYEMEPENPYASIERGDCYAGLGDLEMARQDYERFLMLVEGNPDFDGIRENVQEWLEQNP